jgi:hypothetical protein
MRAMRIVPLQLHGRLSVTFEHADGDAHFDDFDGRRAGRRTRARSILCAR